MVCGVQPGWSGGHPHHNGIIGGDKWCAVCNLVGRGAILTIMESLGGDKWCAVCNLVGRGAILTIMESLGGDKWCAVCNLVCQGAILTIMESSGGINDVRCATWLVGGPSSPLRGSIAGLHRLS